MPFPPPNAVVRFHGEACVPAALDEPVGATNQPLCVAGGGADELTVMEADPDLPALVAMIVVVPAATAVAKPLPETVATALLAELQVSVRPLSVLPAESFATAVNC